MGRIVSLLAALVVMVIGSLEAQDVLVFEDVNVVPMNGLGVRPNQTVIIRDGLIEEIGPTDRTPVPPNATVVQATGRYLAPGLIDFHVHLRSTSEFLSYLRHGVTSIVQLSGGLSGAPDILDYRRELEAGGLVGPTLYTSGPILDGTPPLNPGVSTAISDSSDARSVVRAHARRGYDLIKVYNRLPRNLLAEVVDEAHRLGLPVVGHIPRAEDRSHALQAALDAGMDVIAHGEEFFFTYFYEGVDSLLDLGEIPWRQNTEIDRVTRWVLEAGVAVIPNLSFVAATRTQLDSIEVLWEHPEFRYLEPEVRRFWRDENFTTRPDVDRFSRREKAKEQFLDELTFSLHRAGVPLLLGTDASFVGLFPGASAHLELRQLVEAGLSPAQALATATSIPGAFLREHDMIGVPVGTVSVGARADLVLLADNPLLDTGAVADPIGVVARGAWHERAVLDALRQQNR